MILFLYYLRPLSNLDKTCSGMFTKLLSLEPYDILKIRTALIKCVYLPFSVSFNWSTRILQSRCGKIWTSSAVLKTLLQLMMCYGLVAVVTWVMREPWSGVNKWGKWSKCKCAKRKCLWTFILGFVCYDWCSIIFSLVLYLFSSILLHMQHWTCPFIY